MSVWQLKGLSRRRKRVLVWGLGLVLLYLLAGFLILPPVIRAIAVKQIAKALERPVTIEKVRLNPCTLSITIRGLRIQDKDGQPLLGWDEVYVNFQLVSFFTHAWVFKEVSATKPYFRVQVNKDRSLNVSDLMQKFSADASTRTQPPKPAKSSQPAALRVELLRIQGATASLTDITPREPFHRTLGPLEITLTRFYTDPNNKNPYSFSGTTDSGEKFSWSGFFYLDPLRSQGDLSLEGVSLNKYAALYQDLVRFDIRDGIVDLRSSYQFELSAETNRFSVTNSMFRLSSLKVAEKGSVENLIELGKLVVSDASADAMARRGEIGSILAADCRFQICRDTNQTINMVELARPAGDATNAPGAVMLLLESMTNALAQLMQSTNLWSGTVHDMSATNCEVVLEDRANRRPARLTVDRIAFEAKELSNVPTTNFTAALSFRWETNGAVRADASATLSPPSAEIKLLVKDLDLRPVDPYLEPQVNLLILGSKLGMDATIRMTRTNDALPSVTFSGDASLDELTTVDGISADDLVKWSSLRASGVSAGLTPPSVTIHDLTLDNAVARVILETNGAINLLTVLHQQEATIPLAAGVSNEPVAPARKARPGPAEARPGLVAVPAPEGPADFPVKVSISAIVFSNAQLQVTDRSLQPNVNLAISQVNGRISGLCSDELQRADVRITGKVENTAEVEIDGKLNPLSQKQPTELKIIFKEVDLHPTSPYFGKFVGYRLNKGKLSLDLNYEIAERKLKSKNVIVLDQLMLGEKVQSPEATKLPVKLAIAVLKDRNGKISLNVPIDGSLDDPQFHLGRVITHALMNVLTKIVTSPFAALGAVFGGKGEEISYQEFEAGSSELQPAATEKLDTLIKGLYERPGLQVEIEGSVGAATDLDALRRQKLLKQFQMEKWKRLRKIEQERRAPEELQLTPEDRAEYLKTAYQAAFSPEAVAARARGTEPVSPTPVATTSNRPQSPRMQQRGAAALLKDEGVVVKGQSSTDLEAQLLTTIEVTPSDFKALADARAKMVKDYLLKGGQVEAERIFLTEEGSNAATSKGSRVYLHLQ